MGTAHIGIVYYKCPGIPGSSDKGDQLLPDLRHQGIKSAKQYDIPCFEFRKCKGKAFFRVILIKGIRSIIVLVQKCQGDGSFSISVAVNMGGIHTIAFQEAPNNIANTIRSILTDKMHRQSQSAK